MSPPHNNKIWLDYTELPKSQELFMYTTTLYLSDHVWIYPCISFIIYLQAFFFIIWEGTCRQFLKEEGKCRQLLKEGKCCQLLIDGKCRQLLKEEGKCRQLLKEEGKCRHLLKEEGKCRQLLKEEGKCRQYFYAEIPKFSGPIENTVYSVVTSYCINLVASQNEFF